MKTDSFKLLLERKNDHSTLTRKTCQTHQPFSISKFDQRHLGHQVSSTSWMTFLFLWHPSYLFFNPGFTNSSCVTKGVIFLFTSFPRLCHSRGVLLLLCRPSLVLVSRQLKRGKSLWRLHLNPLHPLCSKMRYGKKINDVGAPSALSSSVDKIVKSEKGSIQMGHPSTNFGRGIGKLFPPPLTRTL